MEMEELKRLIKETIIEMVKENELTVDKVSSHDNYSNRGRRYTTEHLILTAQVYMDDEMIESSNECGYDNEIASDLDTDTW